jgi:8-oxo-dGTP diphosphatase
MKPHIEVAAAIIIFREQVLISQRNLDVHLSGYWEFPGGKREEDESYEDCLVREIQEELDVKVVVNQLFDTVVYEYPQKVVTLKFFLCQYIKGEAKAIGCRRFRWVPLKELPLYQFPPANEPIVKRLVESPLTGC